MNLNQIEASLESLESINLSFSCSISVSSHIPSHFEQTELIFKLINGHQLIISFHLISSSQKLHTSNICSARPWPSPLTLEQPIRMLLLRMLRMLCLWKFRSCLSHQAICKWMSLWISNPAYNLYKHIFIVHHFSSSFIAPKNYLKSRRVQNKLHATKAGTRDLLPDLRTDLSWVCSSGGMSRVRLVVNKLIPKPRLRRLSF